MSLIKFVVIAGYVLTTSSLFSFLVRCFPAYLPIGIVVLLATIAGGFLATQFVDHRDARKVWAATCFAVFVGVVGAWF